MTDETPHRITYDASNNDSLFVSSDKIGPNVVRLDPPPIFAIRGANGQPTVTVHHDGRLEYGPDYQPDEAARLFWEAVEQQARSIQYGAPLNARINEHLKAGQEAERKLEVLASMFEGLERLISTSSRDWGQYRVDAWLWAVLVGWDCEEAEHDETCTHGAMEEMAELHGWGDEAVAKARRYRKAVCAVLKAAGKED